MAKAKVRIPEAEELAAMLDESERLEARDLLPLLEICRKKFGDVGVAWILRKVWNAERRYKAALDLLPKDVIESGGKVLRADPPCEAWRPRLMAKELGPEALFSPSFYRDICAMREQAALFASVRPEARRRLQETNLRLLTAEAEALGRGLLRLRVGRPKGVPRARRPDVIESVDEIHAHESEERHSRPGCDWGSTRRASERAAKKRNLRTDTVRRRLYHPRQKSKN